MTAIVLLLAGGVSLLGIGFRMRTLEIRRHSLADVLALDEPLHDSNSAGQDGPGWTTLFTRDIARVRRDQRSGGQIGQKLEKARIPVRVDEALLLGGLLTVVVGFVTWGLTRSPYFGAGFGVMTPALLWSTLTFKVRQRKQQMEEQFPEVLQVLAATLRSGNTLLRGFESIATTSGPPLAEEMAQVLAETQLGNSAAVAAQNMADRLGLDEAVWLAQLLSMQEGSGGRMADRLENLADVARNRRQIRREVAALTAEGRASAWILGFLPLGLMLTIQITNPSYLEPMYSGRGLVVLIGCGVSIVLGVLSIRRMINLDV